MPDNGNHEPPLFRVLHVEDNAGDVRLIQEALRESGIPHEAYVVRDGCQALEFLLGQGAFVGAPCPDLILLDLNLPKKGGTEVLSEIKRHPRFKTIPVVVLTTSGAPLDIFAAYDLQANCYVIKPVDLPDLFETVEAIARFWLQLVRLAPAAR